MLPPLHLDGPDSADKTFAFAHGAGIGMNSDFMDTFAEQLGARGVRVARFEFPYMQNRRADGKKRPPDRAPVLLETWEAVIEELGRENLIIGGKSMGGRIASMAAAERDAGRGLHYSGLPVPRAGQAGDCPGRASGRP